MTKLFKYLKQYWFFTLMAPVMMAVEVLMDLMQPYLIQKIIDTGIAQQNISYIIDKGLLMLLFTFIGLIGGIGSSIFAVIAAQNVGADLRSDLFKKIQSYSFKKLNESNTGNLITNMTNDIDIIERLIFVALRMLVRAPLTILGSIIMAFVISPKLTLIIFILLPIITLLIYYINKNVYPLYTKVQNKMDQLNTVIQENLAGIRVIKAFVRSDYEKDRFNNINNEYMFTNMKAARIMALVMPLMMLAVNLAVAVGLYFGGLEVINGNLAVGEIVAFINYLLRVLFSMTMAGMIMIHYSRASVSADRVSSLLEDNTDLEGLNRDNTIEKINLKGRIEFGNVGFSYTEKDKNLVLDNINLKINPGETVAIMGETGSGKSTLLRLIPNLYQNTSGEILIDDKSIENYNQKALRKSIGFVLQETILFSDTIENNIAYANKKMDQDKIVQAAKIAKADQFIKEFDQGYQSKVEQRGVNLSGGQKQRIAIARALAADTPIIIFDDSTSALDINTEYEIMKALKNHTKDKTIIIVAQKISSVVNVDKIFLLENGKIIAAGKHEELLKNNKKYQEIYNFQFEEGDSNENAGR
ncbi:MAG: ABC transporter ATP-binding protein [Halanaerobiales bacterium]|nr:ABC transporter ATP-binding protein [Halanaerobiales bacterium]